MKRSVLRQMIAVVSRPEILSFAGGLPAPELFPTEQYAQALSDVLRHDGRALQYAPPYPPLKKQVVKLMAQRGVVCCEEQVFLTTGAQQALTVLTSLLLNPGGQVMLEERVYTGIQQIVAPYRPEILPIPTNLITGLDTEVVEDYLRQGHRPAFLYVIPDAHNPLGVSLSPAGREHLISLAEEYGLPIIEDDPYGLLAYDHLPPLPLRALNDNWIFYTGSFSKILAPALRLGWLVAPESLLPKLTVIKEAGDLECSGLTQRAVAAFMDAGHLPAHLGRLRDTYRERRDTMLTALNEHLTDIARWTIPAGGMFIWLELPNHFDTSDLLQRAIEQEKVAFIPGNAFALPGRDASNCLRLNFSNATPAAIQDGVARLARVIKS